MKFRAHIENNPKSKTVTIKDVIDGVNSKNPEKWEKRIFYSLKYLTPMYAKPNCIKIAPHFAFKKGLGGNEKSGGGESLEHELSKEIILNNLFLKVKLGKTQETLYFSKVILEQRINKGERVADLYVQIKNKNRFDYLIGKGLVIEIHRSNKVTKTKRQLYRNKNLPAIEIDIDKSIRYKNDIYKLQSQLEKKLSSVIEAKSLHDPNYIKRILEKKQREKLFLAKKRKERKQKLEIEIQKLIEIQPEIVIKKDVRQISIQVEEKVIKNKKMSIFTQIMNWLMNK